VESTQRKNSKPGPACLLMRLRSQRTRVRLRPHARTLFQLKRKLNFARQPALIEQVFVKNVLSRRTSTRDTAEACKSAGWRKGRLTLGKKSRTFSAIRRHMGCEKWNQLAQLKQSASRTRSSAAWKKWRWHWMKPRVSSAIAANAKIALLAYRSFVGRKCPWRSFSVSAQERAEKAFSLVHCFGWMGGQATYRA